MNNGILKSGKRRGSHGPGQLKDAQMPILCSTPQGRSHYDDKYVMERWERESEWFVCWERNGTGDAMEQFRSGPL